MKIVQLMKLPAVLLVVSSAGCSSSQPTTGYPNAPSTSGSSDTPSSGSSSGSGGTASGDTSGAGTTAGSSAPSGSSSTSGTASGSSQSGSAVPSSGSSASGSSGSSDSDSSVLPTRGCGQGTSCTPGDDLAPPAAADGFQIATPDNAFNVQPNNEYYYCFYKTIPGNATINVGAFQSWMTHEASHHFILFTGAGGADGTIAGGSVTGGGLGCVPNGTWVYATSTSGEVIELKMPDHVGLPMSAGTTLIFNIHLINTGTTALSPKIKLNILYAKDVSAGVAGAMVSMNEGISVPAHGMADVTSTCTPPVGSKFFAYTTHVHRHGGSTTTGAYTDVNYYAGGISAGQKTNIVHSTDWQAPDVGLWNAPNFLTVNKGDQFQNHCHFVNTDATPVFFGETAASGEMCMSIGYYFPVGAETNGTSNPYCSNP